VYELTEQGHRQEGTKHGERMLNLQKTELYKLLDLKGMERLENKKQRMQNLLKIAEPDEALYREIMLALGYRHNKVQFLELAMITPYSEIRKLKERDIIEQALLYRAGLTEENDLLPGDFDLSLKMEKFVWNYKGVRPSNYPEKRIRDISGFLEETCKEGIYLYLRQKIEQNYVQPVTKEAAIRIVNKIATFKEIGKMRRLEIFFNIILPFYEVVFEKKGLRELVEFLNTLYSKHPSLSDNSITRTMKKKIFRNELECKMVNSVRRYMGLIQLYYESSKKEKR